MLDANEIRRSRSPWSFPVVIVYKKDVSKIFRVDFTTSIPIKKKKIIFFAFDRCIESIWIFESWSNSCPAFDVSRSKFNLDSGATKTCSGTFLAGNVLMMKSQSLICPINVENINANGQWLKRKRLQFISSFII